MYSLYEICKMNIELLHQMIFVVDHVLNEDEKISKSVNTANPEEIQETEVVIVSRYVQIKKATLETNKQKSHVLQIIDISKDIMYDIANGEKKLLALINATVSHEMRNPLNSIVSQNIK